MSTPISEQLALAKHVAQALSMPVVQYRTGLDETPDTSTLVEEFCAMQKSGGDPALLCPFVRKYKIEALLRQDPVVILYTAKGCDRHVGPGMRMCAGCGEWGTGFFTCAICLQPVYCGKECQTGRWPDHKRYCKVFKQT